MAAEKRLGFILPSVNAVVEDDLRRFLPEGVAAHATRVKLNVSSPEALKAAAAEAPRAAGLLGDIGVDAIVFACTGGSVIGGPGSAERIAAQIKDNTGVPATTITIALFEALRALGVKKLALWSPFEEWFNKKEAAFIEAEGFSVVGDEGLGIVDARECAALSPAQIIESALKADRSDADALFLSCANVRALETVETLEEKLGKPVVTSNQVMIWSLLRLAGAPMPATGGGALFRVKEAAVA